MKWGSEDAAGDMMEMLDSEPCEAYLGVKLTDVYVRQAVRS